MVYTQIISCQTVVQGNDLSEAPISNFANTLLAQDYPSQRRDVKILDGVFTATASGSSDLTKAWRCGFMSGCARMCMS